ncbi:MAG: hypothetical protein Q4P08_03810 [Eubacteriales bacterium]|nr:hypothetical protein [Eubacteriales bacterium]
MPEGDDKQIKRPLDQFREDELWRQINAAHARKAGAPERAKEPEQELKRQLEKSSEELFARSLEESEELDDLAFLEDKEEKIRDFVHSLYRGDELKEQRDPGPLREPSINPIDLEPGEAEDEPVFAGLDAGEEKCSSQNQSEEGTLLFKESQETEASEVDNEPSARAAQAEEAERTQAGIRKFRLGLAPRAKRAEQHLNESLESLSSRLKAETEALKKSAQAEDLEAKFLAEEAEREASAREFEAMIKAAESEEEMKPELLAEDTFSNRMPEFTMDGTAKTSSENRIIGSELLNQQEIDLPEELVPEPEAELRPGLRPLRIKTPELETERKDVEAGAELQESETKKDSATDSAFESEPESQTHPLLEAEPIAKPNLIRGPKPMPVSGSQNIIAAEEGQKREKAHQEFQESLAPLRQAAIDQTVQKLQSGALAPPFYVPRLPRQASSFNEALDFARRLHPLPREMQLKQQPTHRTWLLAQLNHCNNQERLSRFAFSLNHEDLALLFPTLASLKRGKHIERLLSIILMRASHYLYLQGWITLQYAYPRSTVEKGLSELCTVLEDSFFPSGSELGELERENLERLNFSEEQFVWTQVRMISEIALPNQRHFLSKIVAYIKEQGQQPEDFYKEFAIYPDLPLAKAIQSSWDMTLIEEKTVASGFSPRQLFD